ncbi:ubiquinol-cytochrome c reductase [Microbulbifer thermotolerans]|uniref:ubiquinol-cytochrome c reductase n=1 Tax=Microbulbifer thermotolerans TaxID=252514 RepID=UPI0022488A94|nr:ubiquinol-cytochrome c reductase [Microbulbifer thermotolerans]MCX2783086.1 ubiquinol-cytochrome c reductase [Microbulbifer thermotolerans]MCX2794312.1 ubiquinol-cytochrome c reductase [Microbulbifer thermotolerans]MCX2841542.1 ubiquinol-cytochrome c reductase [Microbulbifer thermotolerans]WKT61594.1 ubiquinol-cytochrome c reductase [Microbulbifer thermotolerans]
MNWLTALGDWIDQRLPIYDAWDRHMGKYYAPKNFNVWYFFGVFSLLVLVNQLLTGIWLVMSFTPSAEGAFASVEYIMRDVEWGWLIRYMHSTGASAFFVVVYLHMFRGLMYGSYKPPRELVWIFGMCIYLVLMAEAFMGYVLPWGQMSYWGAQVIVSLFGAIPVIGEDLVQWIRGDYLISGITLTRFFSLHVIALPLVLVLLVVLHILALHEVGSNNPDGIEIKKNKDENGIPKDGVPFHPYYTVHDLVGIAVFLFIFCTVVFFFPEMGGFFLEHANFEEANPLKTPPHIAPVWYFTPFYAILRAVTIDIGPLTAKFLGLVAMGAAIAILFVLPWLDKSPVRSIRYKGWLPKALLLVFAAVFIILGYLGVQSPTPGRNFLAQVGTLFYFAFFVTMPIWSNPKARKGIASWIVSGIFGLLFLWMAVTNFSASVFVGVVALLLGAFFAALPWVASHDDVYPTPERVTSPSGEKTFAVLFFGLIVVALLAFIPIKAVGAESDVELDHINIDLTNKPSLQRGAKYFVNYCMGCHSANFSRWERVANDLDIPNDLMMQNLVLGDAKIGDLMQISMRPEDSKVWFGATPPDLTLVARARSPEWLYTYLRSFYKDDSRPTGVNNKVFPNVGMPHVLMELQGLPECAAGPKREHGRIVRDELGNPIMDAECGSLKVGNIKGSMNEEEFDQAMYDLVNFLEYIAEPMAEERKRVGFYVLAFILVFFIFAWLLNREYWKDVHH